MSQDEGSEDKTGIRGRFPNSRIPEFPNSVPAQRSDQGQRREDGQQVAVVFFADQGDKQAQAEGQGDEGDYSKASWAGAAQIDDEGQRQADENQW